MKNLNEISEKFETIVITFKFSLYSKVDCGIMYVLQPTVQKYVFRMLLHLLGVEGMGLLKRFSIKKNVGLNIVTTTFSQHYIK